MNINIRHIKPTDNAKLSGIIKSVFIEYNAPQTGTVYSDPTTNQLFEFFQLDKAIGWVAEVDQEIAGCCGIYPTPGLDQQTCELVKFYLLPQFRNKGIGRQLLYQCEASAIDFGYKRLYIESMPEFDQAVNMYIKAGYKHIDSAMGNSGHTSCSIFMIKELQDF